MQTAEKVAPGDGKISKDWFRRNLETHTSLSNWNTKLLVRSLDKRLDPRSKKEISRVIATEVHKGMQFNPKSVGQAITEIRDGFEGHQHVEQSTLKMRKSNGELATSDAENIDVMGEHFTKVFNNHREIDISVLDDLDQCQTYEDLGKPSTVGEVALSHAESRKWEISWRKWNHNFAAWHKNKLCTLAKQGKGKDHSNPSNRRRICLVEIPEKVQSSIILTRLLKHLEKVGIEETQYGCIPGRGCADALFTIRQHDKKETWAIFVDLVKAFDTADRMGPPRSTWSSH
eukprot:scaffold135307_cov66-Attheya_sp.AAC.2